MSDEEDQVRFHPEEGPAGTADAHLRAILETTHEAFVSMDAGGFIVEWNPQAQITFGWSREEALGRVLADTIIPPQYRDAHWRGLERFLEGGGGPVLDKRIEIMALHREGYEFPVELTISATRSAGRAQFHAFLHDISDRKRIEEELTLTRELAVAIGEAQTVRHALIYTLGAFCEQLDWAAGESWVPRGDRLNRVATWTLMSGMEPFLEPAELSIGCGGDFQARAWFERDAIWVTDLTSECESGRGAAALEVGFSSAIAVPVMAGAEVVAVLSLYALSPRDENGRLLGLVKAVAGHLGAMIRRKQVEERLMKREFQLSQAQRVAHIGSWEWDADLDEFTWSTELQRIFGRRQEDLDDGYRGFLKSVHPDDRAGVDVVVQEALRTNRPFSFDHRTIRPDGDVRTLHAQGEVLANDAGTVTGMVGTAQDLTEQRRLEAERAGFWELSLDMISIAGLDGYLRAANPAHERLLGYTEQELTGRPYIEFVHPADRERAVQEAQRLASGALETEDLEVRVRCKDGTYRTVLGSARAHLDQGVVYTIAKDVTERRRAEERVEVERELALAISTAEGVEDALGIVLRQICETGGWKLGQAWGLAAGGSRLECRSAFHATTEVLTPFRKRSEAITFEWGQGLPGRAWATKEPVWVADVKSDRDLPRAPFAREVGIGAAMAVPVLAREEVVAVLEFFGSEIRERDEGAVNMVSIAASQLGTVIEQKRAEEALRTSEERFRLLVDGVDDYAIIVLDPSGNVASWNPGAARITGYDAGEIIGYHLARFYSPESVEQGEPERNLALAVADGRYEQSEWLVRRDGLRFWADVAITPLRNGDRERLRGFGCVVRNNTERRRTEQALQHLEALIEHSDDAIIGTTAETNIVTSWNPGAERLFGYTAREMVGRNVTLLVPPDERHAHLEVLERVLRGTRVDHYDTEAARKNGSRVDLSVTVSPIKDPEGAVIGVSWIARDVTDRRRAEQYVEKAFGAYLDPEVADHILSQGPALAGQEVDVTMVFVDIRDFTAFSERCEPGEVVETLNSLFERVVPIISERGGHVDKFVGDGLLAVFGAPQRLPDHADRALEAALEIDRSVLGHFRGDLQIAIGIDSGTAIAGNVGGGGRLDFTVIGDAVNMASRVEAATRRTGDTILITDTTRRLLTAPGVLLEERPDVPIKGKDKVTALYAPRRRGDGK